MCTDIVNKKWMQHLPPSFQPYLILTRIDRPTGIWLLFLPGFWGIVLAQGATLHNRLFLTMLFAVGSIIMRSAGCVINDLWDKEFDSRVRRTSTRPLVCKDVTTKGALILLAILLVIGFSILLYLNKLAIIMGIFCMILVVLYPLAKRVTWWPQLILGLTIGASAPIGYVSVAGKIDWVMVFLYLIPIFWQLGLDTIYGFQDIEDDASIGLKSSSQIVISLARPFVGLCYLAVLMCIVAVGILAHLGLGFWISFILPVALLSWQAWKLDPYDARLCLTLFKLNRETGWAITSVFLLGLLNIS